MSCFHCTASENSTVWILPELNGLQFAHETIVINTLVLALHQNVQCILLRYKAAITMDSYFFVDEQRYPFHIIFLEHQEA
mmetsp:Transcript_21898/g.26392  ORF Transcript_21898/g.26392 Transcript_21898/m.26392 type:complete len:80 (-) Transcript_21898:373-612(-)